MDYMKVEITVDEYKVIRDALMERPAREVFLLIAKLDSQVASQNKLQMAEPIEEK